MAMILSYPVVSGLFSKVVDKLGLEKCLSIGVFMVLIGSCLHFYAANFDPENAFLILGSMGIIVGFMSFIFSTGVNISMALFPEVAGGASAVIQTLRMVASSLGTLAGAYFYDYSLVQTSTLIMALSFIAVALLFNHRRLSQKSFEKS